MDIHADRKAISQLTDLYQQQVAEATYGQSAGQELAAREKKDDAFGAPRKATPASGTGKYYKEGKPTDQQLAQRKKREKIKQLTNQGKHKEASALHNEDNYVNGYLDELKKSTLGSYVKKASKNLADRSFDHGESEKRQYEPDASTDREEKKLKKRQQGISRAADKLTKEETIQEKQKDTPDQVKAVIAFDKARKGTKDATYDSEHGDKKQAKKERDYAKWQRDKGAEDAQKSGHPWEHAKGSTREKEGKKSVKHAHIKDSFSNWKDDLKEVISAIPETEKEAEKEIKEKNIKNKVVIDPELKLEAILKEMGADAVSLKEITERESQLWDEVAERLTELHELGGVKFRVIPFVDEVDRLGKPQVSESGWHRRNPEKVGTPADPDTPVLKGSGKVKTYAQTKKENPPTNPKRGGIYKPNKDGKMVKVDEAKVDTGKSADEKSIARNKRNTPPGADKDTDLKTFITRKPGESLDSARQRVRQGKHAARRGGSHNKSSSQGQMMSGKSTIYK